MAAMWFSMFFEKDKEERTSLETRCRLVQLKRAI